MVYLRSVTVVLVADGAGPPVEMRLRKWVKHARRAWGLRVVRFWEGETVAENGLKDTSAILAAPFRTDEVKFKPAVVSGNRALALPYVDARVIMDRLDQAFGLDGWQDEYTFLPDGSCLCKLRCKFGDEWLTKMDIGSPSEQPDEGDRHKAAVSDALKRAAVKFGIGRYLYRLPQQWCDYDPQRRQFKTTPTLPQQQPARGTPAPVPATPPPPLPPIGEMADDEIITNVMWEHLASRITAKGYEVAAWLAKRNLPNPPPLTVVDYREALARVEKAQPKAREGVKA